MGAREVATMHDESFMRMALRLAARGLGSTAPNPAVGCVLVKGGQIVGRGWTQAGGRPHAETVALAQAGDAARGATAYVTLEPCAHFGVTSPCADALIDAGIARVVIACSDPDPRTAGKGIMRLAAVGIETHHGICEADARALNAGFFLRIEKNRPFISLKLATSLDGMIATASGESQWITGEKARQHAHLLRAEHDAILTGIGTALADDPMLNCRVPGREAHSPIRIVLDTHLRLPSTSQLVQSATEIPLWIICSESAAATHSFPAHITVIAMPQLKPAAIVETLAECGITRLLIEAGPTLNTSFYESGLMDEIHWYRAPLVIGASGRSAWNIAPAALNDIQHWKSHPCVALGQDQWQRFTSNVRASRA